MNDKGHDLVPQDSPELSGTGSPKLSPLSESQIPNLEPAEADEAEIEESEVEEPQAPINNLAGPRHSLRRRALPGVVLLIIIIALFATLLSINGGTSKPMVTTTTPKIPVPTKHHTANHHNKHHSKAKKHSAIILPVHKSQPRKHKSNSPAPKTPSTPGSSVLIKDPLLNKAAAILRAKHYSTFYRSHPSALAAYLSKRLNYPVKPSLSLSKKFIGLEVIAPTGNVILAHIPKKSSLPKITLVRLWAADLPKP